MFRQATRIETSEVRQHRRHGASFLTKGAFWISFSTNVEESEPVGGGIYCAAFLNAEPARLLGLQVRAEGLPSVHLHFRLANGVFGAHDDLADALVSRHVDWLGHSVVYEFGGDAFGSCGRTNTRLGSASLGGHEKEWTKRWPMTVGVV